MLTEDIRDGKTNRLIKIEMDTGPHRTFSLYPSTPQQAKPSNINDPLILSVIGSITSFEKSRGSVLAANEQPILVGNIVALEDATQRTHTYSRWSHLKSGFDWNRINIAGIIGAIAIFIYALARGLGWVIDGFVAKPE